MAQKLVQKKNVYVNLYQKPGTYVSRIVPSLDGMAYMIGYTDGLAQRISKVDLSVEKSFTTGRDE